MTADAHGRGTEALLRRLAAILLDARSDPLLAVGVARLHGSELELHLRPLPAVDDLLGFVAPVTWDAFGVVASGTARPVGAPPRSDPVEVAHLQGRDGTVVTELRQPDGGRETSPAVEGVVPEVCRRVLGLPTHPPSAPPGLLPDVLWLDAVFAMVLDRGLGAPPPSWPDILALHPVAERRRSPARGRSAPPTWGELRRRAAMGRLVVPGLGPHEAAWMDEGMFSRFALGGLPPAAELLGDLEVLLPAELFGHLRGALDAAAAAVAPRPGA